MKKRSILTIILLLLCIYGIYCDTPLMRQLRNDTPHTQRDRDSQLSLRERLRAWFPNHFVVVMGNHYYVSTPPFNGIKSEFYVRQNIFNPRMTVIPDTSATITENSIIIRNNEVIPASGLSINDLNDIKNHIAWLTVLFRALGSPVPELMLVGYDQVDTYVIVNENNLRQKIIMPSFTETVKKINHFYQGYTSYFQMNEIVKMNGRIEFYGTLFLRDIENNKTDFVDVRFHTNRRNQINLIMMFVYRDV